MTYSPNITTTFTKYVANLDNFAALAAYNNPSVKEGDLVCVSSAHTLGDTLGGGFVLSFSSNTANNTNSCVVSTAIPGGQWIRSFGMDVDLDGLAITLQSEYLTLNAAVNSAITIEANTRANADGAMASLITNLSANYTTLSGKLSAANAAITNESTVRANADGSLATQITNLSANYTTLGNSVSNLGIALTVANAVIYNESTVRANADSAITLQLNLLNSSYQTFSNAITNTVTNAVASIANEAQTRSSADSALSTQVSSLSASVSSGSNPNLVSDVSLWTLYQDSYAPLSTTSGSFIFGHGAAVGFTLMGDSEFIKARPSTYYTLSGDFVCENINAGDYTFIQISQYDSAKNYINDICYTTHAQSVEFSNERPRTTYAGTGQTGSNAAYIRVRWYISSAATPFTVGAGVRRVKLELGQTVTSYSTDGQAAYAGALVQNETTARATADAALSQQITQLSATVVANTTTLSSQITNEVTARANADSALATQVSTLSANVGSAVTGTSLLGSRVTVTESAIAALNGKTAAYWQVSTVAGNSRAQLSLFADASGSAGVDIVGNVTINGSLIVTNSTPATAIQPGAILTQSSYTSGDIMIGSTETILIETPSFTIGDASYGVAEAIVSFVQDSATVHDTAITCRVYLDTGSDYQLVRSRLQGLRTSSGDTYWALPVSFPVCFNSTGPVRIKVTGQGTTIGGGGNLSGSYARNCQIDIIKGRR